MVLRRIFRLPAAIASGLSWSKALEATSAGDHQKSFDFLLKVRRTQSNFIEYDLLKSYLYGELGHYDDCVLLCQQLIGDIDRSSILSEVERLYCKAYASWLFRCAEEKATDGLVQSGRFSVPSELSNIDLSLVPSHWKLNFPLRIHPDWDQDELTPA